jgi:hypothetical protein
MNQNVRWIAIDPGERWCGLAVLEREEKPRDDQFLWYAHTCVLDKQNREGRKRNWRVLDLVATLLGRQGILIMEDYRARPVGHQAFSGGETFRMLGALEYCAKMHASQWFFYPPGPPMDDLGHLHLLPVLDAWRVRSWPTPNNPEWNHAFSAWRVLGMHLMKTSPETLLTFKKLNVGGMFRDARAASVFRSNEDRDLTAPSISWASPRPEES